MYFIEKERKTESIGEYDVVVCGGGIAGVSAALASARNGAKTILVESTYMLGGLATAGLITNYLPLCDGMGNQICFGIAEELLKLSLSLGCDEDYPEAWLNNGSIEDKKKKRFNVWYNPNVFAILMEKLLHDNKVEILYGASVVGGIREKENKLSAVLIESRSGRQAICGKAFIDCTGDASLYRFIGEMTEKNAKGNTISWWYYEVFDGQNNLMMKGSRDIDSVTGNFKNGFEGIEVRELTEKTVKGHQLILEEFLKRGKVSKKHSLATIYSIPQVRMTRKIIGNGSMDRQLDCKKYKADSVGCFSDWVLAGPVYELSYSCLWSDKLTNCATAGRSISVEDNMWEITRVIPVCAVSGEAVGTAAAMYGDFGKVDITALQERLSKNGVKIHLSELGINYQN